MTRTCAQAKAKQKQSKQGEAPALAIAQRKFKREMRKMYGMVKKKGRKLNDDSQHE
jgi:hypothetical protein